jgi:hypothetical protein
MSARWLNAPKSNPKEATENMSKYRTNTKHPVAPPYKSHRTKSNAVTVPANSINPDYFKTAHAHEGVVRNLKNVYGPLTRSSGMSAWRVWVRITTTEGWVLMGYIGNAATEAELPKVVKGDKIILDPLVLSSWQRVDGMDERPADFSRTLRGKIVRGAAAAAPATVPLTNKPLATGVSFTAAVQSSVAAASAPAPRRRSSRSQWLKQNEALRDSLAIPAIWCLTNTTDESHLKVFLPNVWNGSYEIREYRRNDAGLWIFREGRSCVRKEDAVAQWKSDESSGKWGNRRNITKYIDVDEIFNGWGAEHPADRYARLIGGTDFVTLTVTFGNSFPRKS